MRGGDIGAPRLIKCGRIGEHRGKRCRLRAESRADHLHSVLGKHPGCIADEDLERFESIRFPCVRQVRSSDPLKPIAVGFCLRRRASGIAVVDDPQLRSGKMGEAPWFWDSRFEPHPTNLTFLGDAHQEPRIHLGVCGELGGSVSPAWRRSASPATR